MATDDGRRLDRLRAQALRLDAQPGLLSFVRSARQRLPGDERFGDSLSTAGLTAVQTIARGVTAMQPERDSVVKELGLTGLQLWQSLSEATGRGRGDRELANVRPQTSCRADEHQHRHARRLAMDRELRESREQSAWIAAKRARIGAARPQCAGFGSRDVVRD